MKNSGTNHKLKSLLKVGLRQASPSLLCILSFPIFHLYDGAPCHGLDPPNGADLSPWCSSFSQFTATMFVHLLLKLGRGVPWRTQSKPIFPTHITFQHPSLRCQCLLPPHDYKSSFTWWSIHTWSLRVWWQWNSMFNSINLKDIIL